MTQTTVYDQIGGRPALQAAVDEFYRRVLGDPTLAPYFAETDLQRLKIHQRAFLAVALGGSKQYTGRTMHAVHAERGITDAAFDRVAEHLGATFAALGVPTDVSTQILAGIAPLRSDIVSAPA